MANNLPSSPVIEPISSDVGVVSAEFPDLLGTDEIVELLRQKIPGGLSKRTLYQWCDMGCPHVVIPGNRGKLGFVLSEVLGWVFSFRVQKQLVPAHKPSTHAHRRAIA